MPTQKTNLVGFFGVLVIVSVCSAANPTERFGLRGEVTLFDTKRFVPGQYSVRLLLQDADTEILSIYYLADAPDPADRVLRVAGRGSSRKIAPGSRQEQAVIQLVKEPAAKYFGTADPQELLRRREKQKDRKEQQKELREQKDDKAEDVSLFLSMIAAGHAPNKPSSK